MDAVADRPTSPGPAHTARTVQPSAVPDAAPVADGTLTSVFSSKGIAVTLREVRTR